METFGELSEILLLSHEFIQCPSINVSLYSYKQWALYALRASGVLLARLILSLNKREIAWWWSQRNASHKIIFTVTEKIDLKGQKRCRQLGLEKLKRRLTLIITVLENISSKSHFWPWLNITHCSIYSKIRANFQIRK